MIDRRDTPAFQPGFLIEPRGSHFFWFGVDRIAVIAEGFTAAAAVLHLRGHYVAVALPHDKPAEVLLIGTRIQALRAADRYLRREGSIKASKKGDWHHHPPTAWQTALLADRGISAQGLNRYAVSASLTWAWRKSAAWAAADAAIKALPALGSRSVIRREKQKAEAALAAGG